MSKVVLVRPSYLDTKAYTPGSLTIHLGILGVGSALRDAGYDVILIDTMVHDDWSERLRREAKGALYVGITAMTGQVNSGIEAARIVREIAPGTPVVWGGAHVSIFPEQAVESRWCDVAVIGEGEKTAVQLAECFGNGAELKNVEGIAFRSNEGVVKTPKTDAIEDLDTLSYPAYDLYSAEDLERLITEPLTYDLKKEWRTFYLQCGRGCRFKCTFCINTVLPENHCRYRTKSAARIIEEMVFFGETYGIKEFFLQDEDFFTEKEKVLEFLDLYEQKKLSYRWHANGRANYFTDSYINRKFCERLDRCGMASLGVGFESGSERMLRRMKKGITPEMMRKTARTISGSGIELFIGFMVGMPGEKREDMLETIKSVWEITYLAPGNYFFCGPATYRPYPGVKMFEEAVEMGFKPPATLEGWGGFSMNKWGYMIQDEIPWVEDTKIFNFVAKFLPSLIFPRHIRFYPIKAVFRALYAPVLNFRIRRNYWKNLLELKIYLALKRVWRLYFRESEVI
ncbi:B12-binding domain-containing radical SAM protein [Acidobacteriota bacterium]